MLTPDQIDHQRAAVVAEALTWLGTPYHPNAMVKGAGCDCLTLIVAAYRSVIGPYKVPYYPKDWHLHQNAELYLLGKEGSPGVLDFCREVEAPPGRAPLPADFMLWKFGKCFAHGAIVIKWPIVLHAYVGRPVSREDASLVSPLTRIFENGPNKGKPRPRRFFTVKDWE